jgi:hypothetical protein
MSMALRSWNLVLLGLTAPKVTELSGRASKFALSAAGFGDCFLDFLGFLLPLSSPQLSSALYSSSDSSSI